MSRPLRLLFLSTFYPPESFGGDAVQLQRLARALSDRGHEVEVAYLPEAYELLGGKPVPGIPSDPHRDPLRSSLGRLGLLIAHQSGHPWPWRRELERRIREGRFDVLHFHNISLFGPGVLFLGGRPSLKLYTAHEYWLVCGTHALWKLGREPCEQPRCLRCVLAARRPPQLWRHSGLLQRAVAEVDLFLAPSRFAARMHAERGFGPAMQLMPGFAPLPDPGGDSEVDPLHPRPYFLFAGRLERLKGFEWLLERLGVLPEGVDLLVAGAGSLAPRARALAASDPRLRILGALEPEALGSFYRQALACIVPSLVGETFGLVTVEAFSHRTPVIARDRGALTEILQESGGGWLFRDEGELRTALGRAFEDPAERHRRGELGYWAFLAHWSPEAHLDRYLEHLDETARQKLGRVPWRESSST